MDRIERDGFVAVLYSPGFGAGWYTWNREHLAIVFDPVIVQLVESEQHDQIEPYVVSNYGEDIYLGGAGSLSIRWVPVGTRFRIDEYDGSESVILEEEEEWIQL
jgi:hypothetical protein